MAFVLGLVPFISLPFQTQIRLETPRIGSPLLVSWFIWATIQLLGVLKSRPRSLDPLLSQSIKLLPPQLLSCASLGKF